MFFLLGCPSFHFLINNFSSTNSPTLTYFNLLLFTTASFHFLIYNINVTVSDTPKYFNLFHFTNFFFHFLIFNINITFSPTITHSIIFLFATACFTPFWYVIIKILIGGVTCCWTCSGCFIHKKIGEILDLLFFLLFLVFFSLFSFLISAALFFLNWYSFILFSKRHFHVNIIHPYNLTFVAWNQRIFGYALLHHRFEPQCHIFTD